VSFIDRLSISQGALCLKLGFTLCLCSLGGTGAVIGIDVRLRVGSLGTGQYLHKAMMVGRG
jgi:hypothetical protein